MLRPRSIIFAFILGVLTTVALAWLAMFLPRGNAWYGPRTTEDIGLWKTDDGSTIWQMSRGTNTWHEVVSYWHMQVSGMSLMIPLEDYNARTYDFTQLPDHFRPDALEDLHMNAWYHAVGFPLPALACDVHWNTQISNADITYDVYGGYQLPRDPDFNPRALPLTPLWPGFLIDLLLWSAAWWGVLTVPLMLRRRLRRARNACAHCGYSMRGLEQQSRCPECGR